MGFGSDDFLMVRHPTRPRTLLSVATREEVRLAVAQSVEPQVVVVYSGMPTTQRHLLHDLAASFGLSLPSGAPCQTSLVMLSPSRGHARSVLTAKITWIGNLALVHEAEGGVLEREWFRHDADSRGYLRGILNAAAAHHEEGDGMGDLIMRVADLIDQENCSVVRSELTSAELVLGVDCDLTPGETIELLWKTRSHFRTVDEVLSNPIYEGTRLRRAVQRATRDLDSISMLYTAYTIKGLMVQGERDSRDRERLSNIEATGRRAVESQLQAVNRRLTVVGIALLLPALWLAYWATPSAPKTLLGQPLASSAGQVFIIGMLFLLAVGGVCLGLLSSRQPAEKRYENR